MARETGTVIENIFVKGLITEATGLNFPEHAATDADNVRFFPKGSVERRKGIDYETGYVIAPYSAGDGVVKEFKWPAVAQSGLTNIVVLQQGPLIYFFVQASTASLSSGIQAQTVNMDTFKATSAGEIKNIPCSFSSGGGYLFIAHPLCDPVIVRYNTEAPLFEVARITIRVRDFEGVEDNLDVNENPASLTDLHHYNLRNQGWDQIVRVGTVTNEIGTGGSSSPTTDVSMTWTSL